MTIRAGSFKELAAIGLAELEKIGQNGHIVCGAITTGGAGSVEKNLRIFNAAIRELGAEGARYSVFNQLPFEDAIFELRRRWLAVGNEGYCTEVLTEFYRPLFQSKRICTAWFLPGWDQSVGARWEREECEQLSITIRDLSQAWVDRLRLS